MTAYGQDLLCASSLCALTEKAICMLLAESKGHEIVLAGNLASPAAAALLAVIAEKYRPNNVAL